MISIDSIVNGKEINRPLQYLISTALVVLAVITSFLFSELLGYRVIAFILLVVVSLLSMFFDIWPVLSAAVLSALSWNFFFIPPRFTFSINSTEDLILFFMYFMVASINAVLTYKIRQLKNVELEERRKTETLKLYGTVLNSLSHELRTPITSIIASADALMSKDELLDPEQKQSLIKEVSEAALRLNRQVNNLLNMSRLESGTILIHKAWCDVNELIQTAISQSDENLKTHQVIFDIQKNLPMVNLDFGLFLQILINLLNNAATYSPATSAIKIGASYQPTQKNGCLTLYVEDEGTGFPEGEKEKVFNKFYKLKQNAPGGVGLGLSIVKGFTEAHNGRAYIKNNTNKGARLVIEINTESIQLEAK